MLERALEIENLVDKLNYELKIALLNDRLLDAEDLPLDYEEYENYIEEYEKQTERDLRGGL